eukprot:251695_1
MQRSAKRILRLQTTLKINHLLQNNSDNFFTQWLNQIIELFGGKTSFLLFITNNCDNDILQSIHTIGKKLKLQIKSQNQKNNILNYFKSTRNNTQLQNKRITIDPNIFNLISNESITNICSYLRKNDIEKFKLCSKRIGIICLSEMKKITISILNLNKFINMTKTRYKNIYSLQQQWEKRYQIKQNNQLFFRETYINNIDYRRYEPIHDNTKPLFPKRERYVLCDAKTLVVLTPLQSYLYNINKHKLNRFFVKLEYFNVAKQSFNFVQYILFDPNV